MEHGPLSDPTPDKTAKSALQRRNGRSGVLFAVLPFAMLALAYGSVPLYRMFCQATGYGGTTQRVANASTVVLDRTVEILFDANTGGAIPWTFEPVQRKMDVRLGETAMAFFRATNTSDKRITGTATFNVDPPAAGIHFNKIACFCFTEQTLGPGQTVDMPVTFFVDPALATDKDAKNIGVIVLSYTFFPKEAAKPATAAKPVEGAAKGT